MARLAFHRAHNDLKQRLFVSSSMLTVVFRLAILTAAAY
jgi:hypothetical protein